MVDRVLSLAVLSTICACGGEATSELGATSAGGGGGAPSGVGGASAGQGGKDGVGGSTSGGDGTSAGSGGVSGGNGGAGGLAGGQNGGSSGASAAGGGGSAGAGGVAGAGGKSGFSGAGGSAGMAGVAGQSGGSSGAGGSAGGVAGASGSAGMCPDFQAGFAGGPAMPDLAPEGPSCAGGLTCAGRSCCESIRVKGGLLHLGTDCSATCDPDSVCPAPYESSPEVDVMVTDFALDTFLVTVGRFRKFVAAYTGAPLPDGAGADPKVKGSGWYQPYNAGLAPSADALRTALHCGPEATWTDAPGVNENKPIDCVTWAHAFAFCVWDGGWLPIEAQWEYAAAGGTEDRLYPWGESPPDATLEAPNFCASGTCDFSLLKDVGALPLGAGKWGHLDLLGWGQWTQDRLHPYVVKGQPLPPGCATLGVNCFLPEGDLAGALVERGGPYSTSRYIAVASSGAGKSIRCSR